MLNPKGFHYQWLGLIAGDAALAGGSVYATAATIASRGPGAPGVAAAPGVTAGLVLISLFAIYLSDLYKLDVPYSRARIVRSMVRSELIAATLAVAMLFGDPALMFGRRFLLGYLLISGSALFAWRLAVFQVYAARVRIGVAILGAGEDAAMVAGEVLRHAHLGYRLAGLVALDRAVSGRLERPAPLTVGVDASDSGPPLIRVRTPAELGSLPGFRILAVGDPRVARLFSADLIRLRVGGVEVMSLETLYERITGRLPTVMLSGSGLAFAQGFLWSRAGAAVKRVFDVLFAAGLALVTAPIAIVVMLAIKLDSPGPVLYSQERVGRDGRIFWVMKFRSMYREAERATGAVFASEADPRITRVGGWLRKWRIDELPQLINVLRGEMAVVGPRPERPEFVARFVEEIAFYEYRHLVRPGLTGWAQVCYPYGATVRDAHEKLCYDLYYLKNWSLGFDLQIMLQTIKVVLFGRGSR